MQLTVLVKFSVSKDWAKRWLAEVPEKPARTRDDNDGKKAEFANSIGKPELAVRGRIRKGVVDTGVNCLKARGVASMDVEEALKKFGYVQVDHHKFLKKNQDGSEQVVYCATFEMMIGSTSDLHVPQSLRDGSWELNVWQNPNNVATLNYRSRSDEPPRVALTNRNGRWVTRAL